MFFSMVCFSYGTHDVGESELAAPQTEPPIIPRVLITAKIRTPYFKKDPLCSISFDLNFALEDIN
jgi:hypothetical protein